MALLYLTLKVTYTALFIALSFLVIYLSVKSSSIIAELKLIERECEETRLEFLTKPFMISGLTASTVNTAVPVIKQLSPFRHVQNFYDLYKIIKGLKK